MKIVYNNQMNGQMSHDVGDPIGVVSNLSRTKWKSIKKERGYKA